MAVEVGRDLPGGLLITADARQNASSTQLDSREAIAQITQAKELAKTLVIALPIAEWSLKVSDGWPDDPAEDCDGPAWAGVIPVEACYRAAIPAPGLRTGIPVPESVRRIQDSSV